MLNNKFSPPSRLQIFIWGALIALAIGLFLIKFSSFQIGADVDDSAYIILSRSMLHSPTYGLINTPGNPAPGKFPFVYPLILACFSLIFPANPDFLRIPSLLATLINISLVFWGWRWLSGGRSYWWGLSIAALFALSPITVDLSRRVMSEPVFTTFCLLAIILTEKLAGGGNKAWDIFLLALILFLTVFTRTVGFLLLIIVLAYFFWKKGLNFWKQALLILTTMVVLSGLVVWTTPVQWKDLLPTGYLSDNNARFLLLFSGQASPNNPTSPTSIDGEKEGPSSLTLSPVKAPRSWSEKLIRFINLLKYGVQRHLGLDIRLMVLPIGGGTREQALANQIGLPSLPQAIGYFISFLVILGLFRFILLERLNLFGIFSLLYLAAIFLWYWDGTRLLYPIQAQILLGFLLGIEGLLPLINRLIQKLRPKISLNLILVFVVCGICIASLSKSLLIDNSRQHIGDLAERSTWIKLNVSPQAILMTENPETDFLYSERKTVPYPRNFTTAAQLSNYLLEKGVDYILVAPAIYWQPVYKPFFSQDAAQFLSLLQLLISKGDIQLIYTSDQGWINVYSVKLEATGGIEP
jgi:4-amino-4-deoxy-L-arabinose transferase-like glycosyltransferase